MPKYISTLPAKSGVIYNLRSLTPEDAESLQNFFYQSALDSTHTLHYKEKNISLDKLRERSKQAIESQHDLFLGVFDSEKIIGQLSFRITYPEHPWVKHIGEFGMTVLKSYWGKGIGSTLLKIMETFAKTIDVTRIEAKVRASNARGLALYQKSGYEIEGIRKNAALINGSFEDEYYIAKLLISDIK
jgi:RimJ/RimL family protein N-acetyltransferase